MVLILDQSLHKINWHKCSPPFPLLKQVEIVVFLKIMEKLVKIDPNWHEKYENGLACNWNYRISY